MLTIEDYASWDNVDVAEDTFGNPVYIETMRDEPGPSAAPANLTEQFFIFQDEEGVWVAVGNSASVDTSWSSREPDIKFSFYEFVRDNLDEILEMREYNLEGFTLNWQKAPASGAGVSPVQAVR